MACMGNLNHNHKNQGVQAVFKMISNKKDFILNPVLEMNDDEIKHAKKKVNS